MPDPFVYAIDPDARLAYGRMWGEVTGADMLRMLGAVHHDAAWQAGFDAIWDCRAVSAHIVSPAEIEPLVAEEAASGGGHDVLVESPALGQSAISAMLAAVVQRRGKDMTVATTLEAALASLSHASLPEALAGAGLRPSLPVPLVSALPLLVTDRLRLRPFDDTDAPFLLDLLTQPSFVENVADHGVHSLADALAYLHGRLQKPAMPGIGMWAVEPLGGGPILGMAGLVLRDGLDGPDLGYAFLPAAWGHGYAREASRALVAYARDVLGLDRLFGMVTPGHTPSIRVLEHIGMALERTLTLPDDDVVALYSLVLVEARDAPAP